MPAIWIGAKCKTYKHQMDGTNQAPVHNVYVYFLTFVRASNKFNDSFNNKI